MAGHLKSLPEIHFADCNVTVIKRGIMESYEKASGISLQPEDPVRLFLEMLAYLASVQNGLIDLAGSQNLLAYARGAALDHLGVLMGVASIPAQPARCVVRFALDKPLDFTLNIPKRTRGTTADGKILFATEYKSEIPGDDFSVDIGCVLTMAGDVRLTAG